MSLTVLMNAGPWLPVPPDGYGGIENVIATLVPELRRQGVRVVLSTVGTSTLPVDDQVTLFDDGQFEHILKPYNRVSGIAHAHLHRTLAELRARDDIDLVHDHVEVVGLSTFATADRPTLHTLHWDLGKHREFYSTVDPGRRVWLNGVSADQLRKAPPSLRENVLGHVHLATPLAARPEPSRMPDKAEHVVVLGRVTAAKGQHIAITVARELGLPLILAGPVGPFHTRQALDHALRTDPATQTNPDVRYWCDKIAPHVDDREVRWLGTINGSRRDELLSTARAALFPITWDEPGGTSVTEALALGCPVIGFARGCLPELIDDGRTGLLAEPDDEEALVERLISSKTIDPMDCVREARHRFAPTVMAEGYLRLYQQVLARM